MIRRLFIVTFLMIAAAVSSGAVPEYRFTYYLKERGLPHTLVENVIQDNNGCLWLATWSGLYRFDGTSFTGFRTSTPDSQEKMANNRFDRIEKDGFGQIWALSYDRSLYRFDPRHEKFSRIGSGRDVTGIYKLSSDDFCFTTGDNTILRTRYADAGRNCVLYEYAAAGGRHKVNDIRKDAEDNIWILTDSTLYLNREATGDLPAYCFNHSSGALMFGSSDGRIVEYINGRRFELNTHAPYDIKMIVNIPGTLDLILASDDGRMSLLELDKWKLSPIAVPEECNLTAGPRSLIDSRGRIWIWSAFGGLSLFDRKNLRLEPVAYEARHPDGWNAETNVHTAFIDRQDNIWFTGNWGGIGRASGNDNNFSIIKFDEEGNVSSSANSVRAIAKSIDGTIYAGTKDSRLHLLSSNFRPVASWSLPTPAYSIAQDTRGHLWIGTKGNGVIENTAPERTLKPEFSPRTYRKSDDPYGMNGDLVYCISPDGKGRLWIGSFDGNISYLDISDKERRFISSKNRIPFPTSQMDRIRFITFSPDGKLFACGRKGIFFCATPDSEPELMRFERFGDTQGYDIQHILFAGSGDMYASSFGNGILLYQSGNSEGPLNITTEDGLLSNFVFSAIEDDRGDIWISTYRGLNKYIPTTGDVIGWSYDRIGKDMLFSEGAPLISTGGDIVFNTNAGILHFNPDDISNSTFTPKLFLTSCQFAGGRIYPETDSKIEVRGNGRLSLRFAAVDLNGPERVTYFWRIDGKDGEEWGQLGNRPVLNLDNLEAGRHLLQLRSTNADGIPVGNTLDIEILVRPDKRKYTQVLALLLLTALTASAFVLFSRRKARKVSHPATESIEQSAGKDPDANTEVGSGYEEQNPEEQRFVRVFKAFLEENMDNGDINAEDMATALGVSRSVLFERCRVLLGKAPTEYLRDLRFSKAAEMMAEDRYSISQIAYKTGFNDSHYFSKAFKKRFGVSPTEYRKSVKGS